jgi:hypothetical protein
MFPVEDLRTWPSPAPARGSFERLPEQVLNPRDASGEFYRLVERPELEHDLRGAASRREGPRSIR